MSEKMSGKIDVINSPSVVAPPPKSTSADDLLEMYDNEVVETEAEVSKEAEKQARIAEEVPKKILAKKLVKNLEKQEAATQLPTEEVEDAEEELVEGGDEDEGEESTSEESEEGQEESQVADVKAFKAKYGDKDLDIPEEAVIPVKVNGKDVPLKIKDAVQAFVKQDEFNRNMDRRVGAVSHKEKKLEEEYGSIQEKAQSVIKLAAQGDFIPGIRALAKMVGMTSNSEIVQLEKAMLDNLDNIQKVWTQKTPEQREAYFANRRAEELQKELEATRKSTERQQGEAQLKSKVQTLIEHNGLTEETFWQNYQELAEAAVGEGQLFKDPREIQPEDVVAYHKQVQVVRKVDSALKKVNPALLEEPIADELIKLVAAQDDFTAEDVEKIVRDALGAPSKTVENLNRKVEQANSKGLRTQLKQVSSTKKVNNAVDDEMYEHFFGKRQVIRR
jgi:hypothetical protein